MEYLPTLGRGLLTTLQISIAATVLATVISVLGGMALHGGLLLRWPTRLYVELFRGSSLTVQLFWLYYVLPHFGLSIPAITAGILAIGLNSAAYGAEAVRGGISAVPSGQWEAARALGLARSAMWMKVVLPQVFTFLLPQWGNLLIETLKATSIVSMIAISDLTFVAYQLNSRTFDTLKIFAIVLVIYFAVSQVLVFGVRLLEWRYRGRLVGAAAPRQAAKTRPEAFA